MDNRRRSVAHQAPELDGRKSATTFDTAKVGVLTRHGIAPARGSTGVTSKAKINQDRGVVCWPFNGSHNQALLCIFDGHGMQGEKVSEWCMNQIPVRLEAARGTLAANAPQALSQTVRCLHDRARRTLHASLHASPQPATATLRLGSDHAGGLFAARPPRLARPAAAPRECIASPLSACPRPRRRPPFG